MNAFIDDAGYDPFGRDPEMEARLRPLLDGLVERVFRTQVHGVENLPAAGKALLVCNHGGALPWDALVLLASLARTRNVRPLVEDPVMTAPFLGTLMTRLGCVRASHDNALRLLQRDDVVAVFPEGVQGLGKLFRLRHKLVRFGRGGFVRLAWKAKAPILPVAIVGGAETAPLLGKINVFFRDGTLPYLPVTPTFPLLGPLGLLPLPARWSIQIGAPIDVDKELAKAADGRDVDDVAVSQVATKVRERIQADIGTLVEQRGAQAWL